MARLSAFTSSEASEPTSSPRRRSFVRKTRSRCARADKALTAQRAALRPSADVLRLSRRRCSPSDDLVPTFQELGRCVRVYAMADLEAKSRLDEGLERQPFLSDPDLLGPGTDGEQAVLLARHLKGR